MTLYDQISEDIKAAMKARDKVRLETLRNIKKVFIEAKTAPGANDTLADADAIKIIQKLAKQGREAAAIFTSFSSSSCCISVRTSPMVSWHRWLSSKATCLHSSARLK